MREDSIQDGKVGGCQVRRREGLLPLWKLRNCSSRRRGSRCFPRSRSRGLAVETGHAGEEPPRVWATGALTVRLGVRERGGRQALEAPVTKGLIDMPRDTAGPSQP